MQRVVVFYILFFLIGMNGISFGERISVSSLDINLMDSNQVKIGWKANTNHILFRIFRKSDWMISRVSNIEQADLVFQGEVNGIQERDIFKFTYYFDTITNTGYYYYLVLAGTNKPTEDDLKPDFNYSLIPVVITNKLVILKDEKGNLPNTEKISSNLLNTSQSYFDLATNAFKPEKDRNLFVSNILWKKNILSVYLFWDFENPDGKEHVFSIFKTSNFILSVLDLTNTPPYLQVRDEQFMEDPDAWVGFPNYYTVIVDDNYWLMKGVNQTSEPIWIGNTNETVPVIRETFIQTNLSRKEYQAQFTNK